MDNFGPVILIEAVLVIGGILLFAWWQLRDPRKEREKILKKKEGGRAKYLKNCWMALRVDSGLSGMI